MKKPIGRKCQFTPKQVERMRDMAAEGLRQYDIARYFNVSKTTIGCYLRGVRGFEVDPKPKPDGPGDGPMPICKDASLP